MLATFPRGARPVVAFMFLIGNGNRVVGGFMIRLPRFFRVVPGPDSVRFRFFQGNGVVDRRIASESPGCGGRKTDDAFESGTFPRRADRFVCSGAVRTSVSHCFY